MLQLVKSTDIVNSAGATRRREFRRGASGEELARKFVRITQNAVNLLYMPVRHRLNDGELRVDQRKL